MIDFSDVGRRHNSRVNSYIKEIKRLFKEANQSIVNASKIVPNIEGTIFRFSNYPPAQRVAEAIINNLADNIIQLIIIRMQEERQIANQMVNQMVNELPERFRYFEIEEQPEELDEEKIRGYILPYLYTSEVAINYGRLNNYDESKIIGQLDYALTKPLPMTGRAEDLINYRNVFIASGASSIISRSLLINPGQGTYRSSYRNISRLAINELDTDWRNHIETYLESNEAIVAYRVRISNLPNVCPICEALNGSLFPPTFKWWGFHVSCRCYLEPVFANDEELERSDYNRISSENYVSRPSDKVYSWINDNRDRLLRQQERGTLYDWISENQNYFNLERGI